MVQEQIEKLLTQVRDGKMPVDAALKKLRHLPFEDIDFAQIDHHRPLRKGFPEVIFGEGKTAGQVGEIMAKMARRGENILVTRLEAAKARPILKKFPKALYHPLSRVLLLEKKPVPQSSSRGTVLIISAGTSDIPVAEEALITARAHGQSHRSSLRCRHCRTPPPPGPHRIKFFRLPCCIVAAGMEGALPSVVGGLVN